ncbi:MAG: hypothetical protein MUE81_23460 [Thermoflexibacter sp.]|nr:hypothetical protein [Thermoflexibacter sp.]
MEINEKKKILIQHIKDFVRLSEFLNGCLITHYNLKYSNLLFDILDYNEKAIVASKKKIIPKNGIIELEGVILKYSFHGIGCYFEYGNQVIDFDYYPKIDEKVVFLFSINKIYDFIFSIKNHISYDKEELYSLLEELTTDGVVKNLSIEKFNLFYLKSN